MQYLLVGTGAAAVAVGGGCAILHNCFCHLRVVDEYDGDDFGGDGRGGGRGLGEEGREEKRLSAEMGRCGRCADFLA